MSATQAEERRDRGSAAVQTVLTVPLLGLLVFGVIQFAIYFHAVQIAQTAANEGADAARIDGASDTDGRKHSDAFLNAMAGGALHDGHVTVQRGAHDVRVTVAGWAEQVVPLLQLPVDVSATVPIEQAGGQR